MNAALLGYERLSSGSRGLPLSDSRLELRRARIGVPDRLASLRGIMHELKGLGKSEAGRDAKARALREWV